MKTNSNIKEKSGVTTVTSVTTDTSDTTQPVISKEKVVKNIPIMGVKNNIKGKKGIVDSSDTTDTTVTSVTTDTSDTTQPVTVVTCNMDFKLVYSDTMLDKIFMCFLKNKNQPFTIDKLSEKIGENRESIRITISRNKQYFSNSGVRGKAGVLQLLQLGFDKINERIANYQQKIKLEKKFEEEEKQKDLEKETQNKDLLNESRNFYEAYKKEILRDDNIFFIDFVELTEFSTILSEAILSDPEKTLMTIENAIEEYGLFKNVRVRIKNLPNSSTIMIEDIRSKHINSFISIKARIIQSSDSRPQVINAKFECPSCGAIISVMQMEKKFREPSRCSCGRKGGFKLLGKDMIDGARIILQDLQEDCENTSPKKLNCFVKEDLASKEILNKMLKAGNDVLVNGILKEVPVPLRAGGLSTRFELAIEVNYIETAEEDINLNKLTKEEKKSFEDLAKRINEKGIGELTPSFAPVVIGHEYEKQALILYPCNQFNKPGIDEERNKSNILFIGDTSTAKSVLVKFLQTISIGSLKVVGGSTSAVGITASAQKDDFLGGYMINPGALVLAKDLLWLEELNLMNDEEKSKIQDAMESQYVNVTKAGTSAVFKVRTGIVSCANPILGNFKLSQNITEMVKQFNIPAQLLSRFDSIFLFSDIREEKKDFDISFSMKQRRKKSINIEFDKNFLKKFFYYTRNRKEPIMNEEFEILSSKIYSLMRKMNKENVTSRTSEAMDRMCIASAKLRGSDIIEEKDLERVTTILANSYFALPEYSRLKEELKYERN